MAWPALLLAGAAWVSEDPRRRDAAILLGIWIYGRIAPLTGPWGTPQPSRRARGPGRPSSAPHTPATPGPFGHAGRRARGASVPGVPDGWRTIREPEVTPELTRAVEDLIRREESKAIPGRTVPLTAGGREYLAQWVTGRDGGLSVRPLVRL
jgi:hypothetical protein